MAELKLLIKAVYITCNSLYGIFTDIGGAQMTTVIYVYDPKDADYSHAALVLVDGKRLPMGTGRGKAKVSMLL